jgi:hypothetical protein
VVTLKETFTAKDILLVLRGRRMDRHISSLQGDKVHKILKHANDEIKQRTKTVSVLQLAFEAWAVFRREAIKHRAALKERAFLRVSLKARNDADLPKAEWRVQEEYRRRRRIFLRAFKCSKYGQRECFEAWRNQNRSSKHSPSKLYRASWATPPKPYKRSSSKASNSFDSPPKAFDRQITPGSSGSGETQRTGSPKGSCSMTFSASRPDKKNPTAFDENLVEKNKDAPIGTALMAQVTGKHLLAELAVMESLYETRIAAAERLLANFVIFHRAVKPVARVWGLSFDLDRSESRLRVASTPAPVPFVETLRPMKTTAGEAPSSMTSTMASTPSRPGDSTDDTWTRQESDVSAQFEL